MKIKELITKYAELSITVAVAVFIVILDVMGAPQEWIFGGILAVLSILAFSIFKSREETEALRKTTEKMLEGLEKPSIDQSIIPYSEWMDEIRNNLTTSKEVWILSRTCMSLWSDYSDELTTVLTGGDNVRMMLVDPRNGALQMIAKSADFVRTNDPILLQQNVMNFLDRMSNYISTNTGLSLSMKTIDYLPHWTLIFTDPDRDHGSVFVELGTYRANGRSRPTFWLNKQRDRRLFEIFFKEFNQMWNQAHPIKELEVIKT